MDEPLTGLVGRVTVPIAPGHTGEVMLPVRGSTEPYSAITEEEETIAENARVLVIDQLGNRTVLVSSY
jgi:hypothetical protein